MTVTDDLRALALRRRNRRERIATAAKLAAARLWRRLDKKNLTASWDSGIGRDIVILVAAAQLEAARGAEAYVDEALAMQGIDDPDADGRLIPEALAGVAPDGRPLASLLYRPVVGVKSHLAEDVALREAMDMGLRNLQMIVDTAVVDAGRAGDGVGVVSRRKSGGYVRVLMPPSCARCAILAGVIYGSERAFQRHPRCDCVHMPAGDKDTVRPLLVDVKDYFRSLSTREQNRIFTNAGAEAIRLGADPAQVVNARRGMSVAGSFTTRREGPDPFGRNDLVMTHRGRVEKTDVFRRQLFTTTEGTTKRGFARSRMGNAPFRLMPESIYQISKDRDEILRLLRRYGYLS